ncbi:MAG: hypothetical protein IT436_16220 [Phycisphaerales bacterium]|nr:hypothetical protein [Phycisphaerales bacterium]
MQLIDPPAVQLTTTPPGGRNDSDPVGLIGFHVRVHYRRFTRALLTLPFAALAIASIAAGCGSTPAPAPRADATATSPTSITVRGDWDDVGPALEVALSRAQMAILTQTENGPDRLRYDLLTIASDPATLTATRAPGAGNDLIDIQLEARVGHFGDPQRELDLLTPLAARLRQLAGKDFAPVTAD